jgi:hypothetical protein
MFLGLTMIAVSCCKKIGEISDAISRVVSYSVMVRWDYIAVMETYLIMAI